MLKLATTGKEPNSITACGIVKHYANVFCLYTFVHTSIKKDKMNI